MFTCFSHETFFLLATDFVGEPLLWFLSKNILVDSINRQAMTLKVPGSMRK